jgi:glyoxylase-like metal-dependent hydrolase (beta-lactamase superfamily II)
MRDALHVKTYLSGYKPIPSSVPGWDPLTQATWPATTATLISAGGQAVLIDALMTTTEAKRLGEWIEHSGAFELNAIYVTHGHADHFFGAATVLERFPSARLISRPDVAEAAREQTSAGYLQVWNSFFPNQITDHPAVPNPMTGDRLIVGEHVLTTIDVGYSDVPLSSVVHIPDLDTVVCGDVAYNDMHMWLAGSTAATRLAWLNALNAIDALRPRIIIVGHKDPSAADDDADRILDQSRQYLSDFHEAATSCDSPQELISTMAARYPALGNPYTLWVAAHDQPELAGIAT